MGVCIFRRVLLLSALALLAACHEGVGPGACFEPNARPYNFDFAGDTNLVFHWPSSYMPVRVYAEPTADLPANVQAAMQLWVAAFRCNELSLTTATDSTHADIIVRNPLSLPAALRTGHVMHADSVGACQGVTHFDLDSAGTGLAGPLRSYVAPFPGADSASAAACYHFVTAHELGHALGILSHSPDAADLMYAAPFHRALTEADRYTIQLLYHTPSKLGPPPRR
jgi:predicted Zn-dependent protease